MEDQGGDNMRRAPQLTTSPCRLNQSLSRLEVPGLNGADGADGNNNNKQRRTRGVKNVRYMESKKTLADCEGTDREI